MANMADVWNERCIQEAGNLQLNGGTKMRENGFKSCAEVFFFLVKHAMYEPEWGSEPADNVRRQNSCKYPVLGLIHSLIYTAEKFTCHLGVKPRVKRFNVSVCVLVSALLPFSTLLWLMSSWYGMWAGRYVCRSAQKARPSLQLLLKLVTSIFWKRNRWVTNNSLAIMKSSECSLPRREDEPPGNMDRPWRKRKKSH